MIIIVNHELYVFYTFIDLEEGFEGCVVLKASFLCARP